jgi:hypothetical protein
MRIDTVLCQDSYSATLSSAFAAQCLLLSRLGNQSTIGRMKRSLLVVLLSFASISATHAAGFQEPDWSQYSIPPWATPADGLGAAATTAVRARVQIEYLACAEENHLMSVLNGALAKLAQTPSDASGFNDNGMLDLVMAKIEFLKLGNAGCDGMYNVVIPFYDKFGLVDSEAMHFAMANTFGSACAATYESAGGLPGALYASLHSVVSGDCLKAEVNFVLSRMQQGNSYPGTDGLPCNITGKYAGDWDVRMKTLIRMIFLDARQAPSGAVLEPATRDHMLNDLISVDGGPGPASYSWTACGDNEKETGNPQDREDDDENSNDLGSDIGDILTWLLRRLIFLAAFLGLAYVLVAYAGIIGVLPAAIVVIGTAAILSGQISETENHRLMIESTRYLNNQLIIQELGPDGAPSISSGQASLKTWLLNEFQTIAKNDFIEYNARPYQEYSLTALRNLSDFSTDADVRTGAQMLLEYSAAKYALGSNQGRRLVPFRRRLPAVACIMGGSCDDECNTECGASFYEIFHPKGFGDFQVQLGLLFMAQTQQSMNGYMAPDLLNAAAATSVAYAAPGSRALLDPIISDLAIRKDQPYFQRIHHAGYEVYSSTPSALITAGGLEEGHAYGFDVAGVPLNFPGLATENIGGALPTTVIFTGAQVTANGQSRMTVGSFISFQGTLRTEGSDESFDDNMCVWKSFACGQNIRVPPDIIACMVATSPTSPWFFLNSATCPGYTSGPPFYMVLYLICDVPHCLNNLNSLAPTGDTASAGFLEIVDHPSIGFNDFITQIEASNAGSVSLLDKRCLGAVVPPDTSGCQGIYHSYSGHSLALRLKAQMFYTGQTEIVAIDGVAEKNLSDWNLAEGNILSSTGDGEITINNPLMNVQLILDFRDATHPCRRSGPTAPCLQQ